MDSTVKPRNHIRYSIPELLDLSARITTPFDLSRLSFNSVRAGIVPVLADRVMAPRESAVQQRTRGWSQQTTETSEDIIVFQGNRAEFPLRQPITAPPEARAQKAEGFANFLKTHSSPNHHRVTAGGRIVPMEKREAPPPFQLSTSRDKQNTASAPKQMMQSVSQPTTDGMSSFAGRNNGVNSPTKINGQVLPSALSPQLLSLQQAALESNLLMQSQLLSYGQSGGSMYSSIPNMSIQSPILGQQFPMNLPYLQPASPFAQTNMSNGGLPIGWHSEPQLLPTLQDMLSQANQSFDCYDQQLKDLDKYRATHPREDELVRQRMDIVVHRASVKEEIRRLQTAIDVRQNAQLAPTMPQPWSPAGFQSAPTQQYNAPAQPITIKEPSPLNVAMPKNKPVISSKLNVKASEYVPMKSIATSSPGPSPHNAMDELHMSNLPTANYSRIDAASPELKITDAWGLRIGQPPAQLLKEQSLLAESMLSELNSPQYSGDEASDKISARSVEFALEPARNAAFGSLEAERDRTGRAPAFIEADYEKQMDAMRQPKGTTTRVTLSDGKVQVVQGLDLKPPKSEDMTGFEKSYWIRKPAYPDYLGFGNKENSRAASFTAKTSTVSFDNPVLSRDQSKPYRGSLQESPSRQVLSELSATIAHNSNSQDEWNAAIQKLQTEAAPQANDGPGPGFAEVPQHVLHQEALANKTFSSTSVSNIHANSHIPRSLDGAVEAGLRKVNSPSKSSSKTKSPKSPKTIFHSSGDAWFGPFRRNFYDTKLKDNEDVVTHFGRVR